MASPVDPALPLPPDATVRRRLVFFIGGYEPHDSARQYARFSRELERSASTWSMTAAAGPLTQSADGVAASWPVVAEGPNWRVETEICDLRWDDIVRTDFARPDIERIPRGIAALVDFVMSGAIVGYFRTNWRYALFALYPLVAIIAFAVAGALAGKALAILAGLPLPWLWGLPAGVAAAAVLFRHPGERMFLPYLFNDWIFARDFARRSRPETEARIARFRDEMAARIRATEADEILLVGHSLGAVYVVEVLARLLRSEPDLPVERIAVATVGASIPKVGLHPAAAWLRTAIDRVCRTPGVFWVEYQALVDIINFYKVNPATGLGLDPPFPPRIMKVRIREMLTPEAYGRFKTDFFRLHRQFVMGNDRRYHYDYMMMVAGPVPLRLRASGAGRHVLGFDAAGRYMPGDILAAANGQGQ